MIVRTAFRGTCALCAGAFLSLAGVQPTFAGGSQGFISDEAIAAWDKPNTGLKADIGPGVLFSPKYIGSSNYDVSAIPVFDIEYKDVAFASFTDGVGLNLINSHGFTAGPVANWMFARQESDDRTHLKGLNDVPFTIEAGGFVAYETGPFEARAELRQGVNGHEGLIGEVSTSLKVPLTTTLAVGAGANVKFADNSYMDAYFSVSAGEAVASGLSQYDAGGGLLSAGLSAFAAYKLSDSFTLITFAQYDRLLGDAETSPIVTGAGGSKDQFYVGSGLTYAFKWN